MSIRFRVEKSFISRSITPKHQDIINSQEIQINQSIFCLIFTKSAANEMWYSIYFVMVHDSRTDGYSTGPFSYIYFFKPSIGFFLEHRFTAMIGNINE